MESPKIWWRQKCTKVKLYPMHEIDVPPHLPEVGMFASTDMPDA